MDAPLNRGLGLNHTLKFFVKKKMSAVWMDAPLNRGLKPGNNWPSPRPKRRVGGYPAQQRIETLKQKPVVASFSHLL